MTYWNWHSYKYTVKRYFKFTADELRGLMVTILVLTFIAGFNDGSETFVLSHWLVNFLAMLVIVTAAVFIQQAGHRLAGQLAGFRVEYQVWWNGLLIGLVVSVLSQGNVWIFLPGGIMIHHMAVHRIGFFRYGANMKGFATVALFGPLFNLFFAGIAKTLVIWFPNAPFAPFLDTVFFFNLVYAAFNLIPIPPLAGSRIMFHSRLAYAMVIGTLAGYGLLALFDIYSYVYALLIGFVVYILFFYFHEYGSGKKEAMEHL